MVSVRGQTKDVNCLLNQRPGRQGEAYREDLSVGSKLEGYPIDIEEQTFQSGELLWSELKWIRVNSFIVEH